jgi:hypothetical protein
MNLHRGGGETEGQRRYKRGSGGSAARDIEAALSAMAAGRTGGGGMALDRRTETKERAEWAAKARWDGFGNGK